MCGIAGWLWNQPPSDPKLTLSRMADRIVHRGPDAGGFYVDAKAGLAHRRLSIIDLNTGDQPMANADKTIHVVFNGEIYNFLDIRKDLQARGHRLATRSDTEVLLYLWQDYGPRMLEHLRGMFAFAIWDTRSETLFLARDRLGVKPLLYAETPSGLFFASELQALLAAPDVSPVLDIESLDLYLSLQYVPAPRTIYTSIRKLPPGHFLIARKGRVERIERYWDVTPAPRKWDRREAVETLREKVQEAVRIRMISDVPLGAFLSGGIDSSITVGLMSRCADQPVKTFSIGFEESDYSELAHARRVAEFHATDHREFVVRPDAIELLPTLVRHYGEPYADSSAIPTYYLCRETRRHVTVALSGDGGDEGFLGYNRYLAMRVAPALGKIPASLRNLSMALLRPLRKNKIARQAARLLDMSGRGTDLAMYLDAVSHFSEADKAGLYTANHRRRMTEREGGLAESYLRSAFRTDVPLVQALSYLDLQTYLPEDILVKVDIASMANSLETRSAFLDQDVIQFAMSLPPELKMPGWRKKDLLKNAFSDLFPPGLLRRGKMGFGVPLEHWFRKELKSFAEEALDRPPEPLRTLFQPDAARNLLRDHIEGRRKNDQRLWNLLFLYTWARLFPISDIR
ncbi:asparagine synthase (glutamine-hydrolyzing) [bacterium]|nr:asparagine synthase (glutamine-hydrolyzing) [bacterium]